MGSSPFLKTARRLPRRILKLVCVHLTGTAYAKICVGLDSERPDSRSTFSETSIYMRSAYTYHRGVSPCQWDFCNNRRKGSTEDNKLAIHTTYTNVLR